MGNIFGLLDDINFFSIPIQAYNPESSCLSLDVADDTIDDVLAIYSMVLGCLFVLFVAVVVVLFADKIPDLAGVCNMGPASYADGVFDSVFRDANDLESDNYHSVQA